MNTTTRQPEDATTARNIVMAGANSVDGDAAKYIAVLAAAALASEKVGNASFVLVPPNYTHRDITELVEKAQPTPNRKHGVVQLKSVDSLVAYCADQGAQASAYVYADPDARTITAVFNDQQAVPGWRDHRAVFKAEYTPEFEAWLRNDKQPKDQVAFAEFLEANAADIVQAAQLLDMATTLSATTGIAFKSARRLDNGQNQLTYTETINATAGSDGNMTIPKEFDLGLRIFKNGDGYKLKARLKYRMNSGAVKFWYELDRPERSVEDAFKGYVDAVREKSGYTVLLGAA